MNDRSKYRHIDDCCQVLAMYATGRATTSSENNKAYYDAKFKEALERLARAAGYRLVPANDREVADA